MFQRSDFVAQLPVPSRQIHMRLSLIGAVVVALGQREGPTQVGYRLLALAEESVGVADGPVGGDA